MGEGVVVHNSYTILSLNNRKVCKFFVISLLLCTCILIKFIVGYFILHIWGVLNHFFYTCHLQAEKEPILSSFLYASILSHDCLERALAFVLANRLQNPTLLATQLLDIFCDVMMHDKAIQRSIRMDVQVIIIIISNVF